MNFKEEKNHNRLTSFYSQNGLEVDNNPEADNGAVFSIVYENSGTILAAATLSFRCDVYILDYIAVDKALRRKKVGSKALEIIIKKTRDLGGDTLYLSARNPMFFKAHGFVSGKPKTINLLSDCLNCEQYKTTCNPENLKLDLK